VISALKTERGLALPDLLNGAFEFIDGLQLKPAARVYLLDILATIEYVVSVHFTAIPTDARSLDIDWRLAQVRRYS
jgi:hypothetical protein